ncbi:MAG: hypothetical protein U1F11_09115 [Steroidobacteraceae bacterium]
MTIEPRRAAPGAVLRWSRQACALIARGFGYWLGLVLLVCLWMFVGQRLPLIDGMLALAAFFASILIAAQLDGPRRATLSEVLRMLRAHAFDIGAFAGIIACAGALIWIFVLARPGVPWWSALYAERGVVAALSEDWFVATRQVFVYSAYALGLCYFGLNIPGLTSFFQFPCTTLLGLPFRDAYKVGALAQARNLPAILAVGLMFILLPFGCVLLLPPLVPLLYCFLGALTYVSFREIFLGVGENRAVEPAGATSSLSSRA